MLCVLMLVPCLASCATSDDTDPGAYITMYLTDEVYDFDPINAYYNSSTFNVASLLYDTLFTLNEKGEVEKSLVKDYKKIEDKENNEYALELTLNDTCWSDGTPLTADDVIFAWQRLLKVSNSYEAASLLFDIKNARAVKEGDVTIDDLGLEALESKVVKVTFEGPVNYDQFLLNLTSILTAPLSESYVSKDADWAKKGATIRTSGAYKLGKTSYTLTGELTTDHNALDAKGNVDPTVTEAKEKTLSYFILERNRYYYRNDERDAIKSSVTNYRILVDCTKSEEEILSDYKSGKLFYIGDVPFALRNNEAHKGYINDNAKVRDSLSTLVLYLNENAVIADGANGTKLFANTAVRKALSLAIDRGQIASLLGAAEAATGLVPNGVINTYNKGKSETFRSKAGNVITNTAADLTAARNLLSESKITASNYSFAITVAAYDKENLAVANALVKAWGKDGLGFNVTIRELTTIENNDISKLTGIPATDICDDQFTEAIRGTDYEVILSDAVAFSADPFSMLASYAKAFSGMSIDMDSTDYALVPHRTGYDSTTYNNIIEAVYYVPYFASLNRETGEGFLGIYETKAEFQATYDAVKAIYDANGISPTTDASKWPAQKATLLAVAEKQLLADMPVIPVVFNKDVTLTSDQLTDVKSTYYVPATFQKADLKNYLDYTYTDSHGNKISIFATFPEIDWDKKGYEEPTVAPIETKK